MFRRVRWRYRAQLPVDVTYNSSEAFFGGDADLEATCAVPCSLGPYLAVRNSLTSTRSAVTGRSKFDIARAVVSHSSCHVLGELCVGFLSWRDPGPCNPFNIKS